MRLLSLLAIASLLVAVPSARAQDEEGSLDIDLGSSRIGGPGLTEGERRRVKAYDAPIEYLTEETLPEAGSKKRLPSLHKLANDYVTSKQWQSACDKFDTIVDEFQDEGVKENPDGPRNATRSYLYCGRMAARSNEYGKAEMYLDKSEQFGDPGPRHKSVRLKMARDQYRSKLTAGDTSAAIKLFNEAQQMGQSEDERIFLGGQLGRQAVAADKAGDNVTRDTMMRHLAEVAPQNTDYRMLKEKLESQGGMVGNLIKIVGASLLLLLLGSLFMKWKNKRQLKKAMGNPFDDDDAF